MGEVGMSSWTLHTGCQSDEEQIIIDWFNENNVQRQDELRIRILPQDKPRTLVILLNGVEIGRIEGRD